jgi:hypothetical protein
MAAKQKMKTALRAIEDAMQALKRAQNNAPSDDNIRQAIRELDDAETYIERAIREIED